MVGERKPLSRERGPELCLLGKGLKRGAETCPGVQLAEGGDNALGEEAQFQSALTIHLCPVAEFLVTLDWPHALSELLLSETRRLKVPCWCYGILQLTHFSL